MKTTLTTTLLFLITTLGTQAQRSVFFNLGKEVVEESSEAFYIRQIASMEDSLYLVADSYFYGRRAFVGFTHDPKKAYKEFDYCKEGQYFTYNDSNRVEKLETFIQGKQQGDQFRYNVDGSVKSWTYCQDDQPYFYVSFYESGAIEDSLSYDYSGEKVRMQRYCYHLNGQPERIELLEDDELIESICFNDKGQEIPYVPYQEMPEFPGGESGLQNFLSRTLRYPLQAEKRGVQGRVYVKFIVDDQGRVSNAEVLRSVHPDLDEEALRVVNKMPVWKPGKRKGVPVRVSYTVPMGFILTRDGLPTP